MAGVTYSRDDVTGSVANLRPVDHQHLLPHTVYGMRTPDDALTHSLLTVQASIGRRQRLMTLGVLGNGGPFGLVEPADLKGLYGDYVEVEPRVYEGFVNDQGDGAA